MPRSSQLHQNRPLENVSIAFKPVGFIADMLSPRFPVKHESDTYYVYDKANFRIVETLRADGAESNKATFNLSTASYQLSEHALHDDITDRQRGNADKAIRLDVDVTEDLTSRNLLQREKDLADLVQASSTFSNTLSLTSTLAWNANTTLSNPITQIDSASTNILTASGKLPNFISTDEASFRAAKEHVSIVDRVKHTSAESVTKEILAKLFNLDTYAVAQAQYNTAEEGQADSLSDVWTDTAIIAFVEKTPGLKKASGFYTFWKDGTSHPFSVKKWREEKIGADRIEVSSFYDSRVIASDVVATIVNLRQ